MGKEQIKGFKVSCNNCGNIVTMEGGEVMPYIKGSKRIIANEVVDVMANANIQVDGDLNYVLFAFCKRHIKPSYNNYKNFCGELRQCATEIERRLLGPHEDKKREENGDV